jgi:hypothetical protein
MKSVKWLPELSDPCEAFLGSDECLNVEDMVLCSSAAEVHIEFNSGEVADHCYHHYITRTAFPHRVIAGKPLKQYATYTGKGN